MQCINFTNGEHNIYWVSKPEQDIKMSDYRKPFKKKLAEEQAAKYRRNPDKYSVLESVASLLDEGIYHPYLGTVGGDDTYILYKTENGYAVQYQYLDNKPIWLTEPLSIRSEGVYRVTPTSLGYIVHYEVDISDYENW